MQMAVPPSSNLATCSGSSSRRDSSGCGIHICVLLEKTQSNAYPLDLPSYPLMFVHATKPLQLAIPNSESHNAPLESQIFCRLNDELTIWEVPIMEKRTVDFSNMELSNYDDFIKHIVILIIKYKIVYFKSLPINYYRIFKHVIHSWSLAICRNARMRQSIAEH
nr:GrBNV gp94-like protein [Apis mellifera nudivirus]